jgi:hypothetical protein
MEAKYTVLQPCVRFYISRHVVRLGYPVAAALSPSIHKQEHG